MNVMYEKIKKCTAIIQEKTDFKPEVALVLGSGLGEYAKNMEIKAEIPYSEIEGFPVSTVSGHEGKFLFGYVKDVPMVMMQGRVHYYEGYDMSDVVMPIRIMGMLGAKTIMLTNAAGGINTAFRPGDLMLITDHISTMVPSPLIGPNIEELGVRFPDMSKIYTPELQNIVRAAAKKQDVRIQEGVYVQCSGPNYESPAEIRMLRTMGADAAGMSTVCEAMAAAHMGLKVCGISCITNMACGILDQPLDHTEVQMVANQVKEVFEALVTEIITTIPR